MLNDLTISDILAMQKALHDYHDPEGTKWTPLKPSGAHNYLLYMIEEVGEAIAIMKKKGDSSIMEDTAVRAHFVEELGDVLMYYSAVLLSYGITPEEFSTIFYEKHQRNIGRDFHREYEEK